MFLAVITMSNSSIYSLSIIYKCATHAHVCAGAHAHTFRGQRWMTAVLSLSACSLEKGSLTELLASLDAGKTQRPSCLSALRSLASCHPLPPHLHHGPGVTGSHRNTRLFEAVAGYLNLGNGVYTESALSPRPSPHCSEMMRS